MLGSISLLGERARGRRWSVTVSALTLGALAAGASLGLALGFVGSEVRAPIDIRATALTTMIAVTILVDLVWLPRRIGPVRQVNDQWLRIYRGSVAGGGFGLQLGLAVATVVTSATTYLILASMILVSDTRKAIVIGVAYGGIRAATVLFGGAIRKPQHLARADRFLTATDPSARLVVVAAMAAWLTIVLALWEGS